MIFYFSATGNSKYLAQKLQDITGDEMYDIAAELRGIADIPLQMTRLCTSYLPCISSGCR